MVSGFIPPRWVVANNTNYIPNISTWDSGGGMELDMVEFVDGTVLGISDEEIVLYPSMEALMSGESPAADSAIVRQ